MEFGALVAVGRTSDVYEYGSDTVIKVPRRGVPSLWAEIEAELTIIVHEFGLPAPAVMDVVEVNGNSCGVYQRIRGERMWERMVEQPSQAEALVGELVTIQRLIHSAGLPEGIPDLLARLTSKLAGCEELSQTDRDEAQTLAATLPGGAAILHGDLHPGNVLLGADGPIAIDWFDASIGHPLADVVRTSLLIRPGFAPADQMHLPGANQHLLQTIHQYYIEQWSDLLGSARADLRRWEAAIGAARLSEGAHQDPIALLSLWNRRSDLEPGVLLGV